MDKYKFTGLHGKQARKLNTLHEELLLEIAIYKRCGFENEVEAITDKKATTVNYFTDYDIELDNYVVPEYLADNSKPLARLYKEAKRCRQSGFLFGSNLRHLNALLYTLANLPARLQGQPVTDEFTFPDMLYKEFYGKPLNRASYLGPKVVEAMFLTE